jgi:hypothetical protein
LKKFLRRLRGILGTGLTWAFGWVGANALVGLVSGVPLGLMLPLSLTAFAQGFVAGGAFATILSIAERRHTLEELSLRRVALWGGIGGMIIVLPALPYLISYGFPLGRVLLPLVIDGLIGAGFASGSVALARQADTKLLDGGEDSFLQLRGE